MHLFVDVRSTDVALWSRPSIENFYFERIGPHGKNDTDTQCFVESIAVFYRVDTGLGDCGLQVFDAFGIKAHQMSDARRRVHGYLFKAETGREPELDAASVLIYQGESPLCISEQHQGRHIVRLVISN